MNLRAGEAGIHLHLRKIFAPPGASLSAAIVVSASIACPRARNGITADQGVNRSQHQHRLSPCSHAGHSGPGNDVDM